MPHRPLRYCRRADTALIEVAGSDARTFLHAQLSLAIPALPWDTAPLAGWHDPKGRVRALFRLVPTTRRWLLVTPRASAAELVAKLRMFVLRSDVRIAVDDDVELVSVVGGTQERFARLGIPSGDDNAMTENDGICRLRIGPELAYLIGPADALTDLVADCEEAPGALAELAEMELGIAAIPARLEHDFVAQMLNLERLGAISFDKGCFPGQEVIARIHNLGSVKRRAQRFAVEPGARIESGAPVHDAADTVVGQVVRAAEAGERCELLAVVGLDAATQALYVDRRPLRRLSLPWDDPERAAIQP